MSETSVPYSKAKVEMKKALLRMTFKHAGNHLAMIEILESVGGEMTAFAMAEALVERSGDDRNPHQLLLEIGCKDPDQMLSLRSFI